MRTLKIFNTILLFFVTFLVIGQEIEQYTQKSNLMEYMLANSTTDFDLTQGIDMEALTKSLGPFNSKNFVSSAANYSFFKSEISTDNNFISDNFEHYYKLDFDEDPFNGKIQIYVMGEPLPSPAMTLFVTFGVVGILLYYKKRKQVTV